jgi:hypothetical protein
MLSRSSQPERIVRAWYQDELFDPSWASGTMTIESISEEHVTGSFDIDWSGMDGNFPSQRRTAGSFNVGNRDWEGDGLSAAGDASPSRLFDRIVQSLAREADE